MEIFVIEPRDSFGPITSVVWVFLVGWCVTCLFGFSLWRFLVFRGRALRAESTAKQPQALAPGPALLSGRVETDDDGPAVRVEIDQVGKETQHKNSWSHRWEEGNRTVHVRPFRLRLANQETVTVVPDDRIRLVDTLETERHEGNYRRRVAELTSKEQVWVSGVLAQEGQKSGPFAAYRTVPGSLILRGTRMEPLEVASGSLDTQFAYWRRFYRKAAWALGVVALLVHGALFVHFYALLFTGKVETLAITNTTTFITTSKNSKKTHYVIHAVLKDKTHDVKLKDEVSLPIYQAAKNDRLKQAPFIYSRPMPFFHSIGTYADLPFVPGALGAGAAIAALIAFLVSRKSAMPWYEQAKVTEAGPGRLETGAWRAQIPGKPGLFEERPPRKSAEG